jgi:hypothetical protein
MSGEQPGGQFSVGRMDGMTRTVVSLAVFAALTLLAGCTPVPPDAWRIAPISYDNLSDVEDGTSRIIDVTYPMDLVPDTAGGLWGESAGSWLHLDADGTTIRRFNLDGDDGRPIFGLAALTPETLLVSTPPPDAGGGIQLFDTVAGTWELLHSEQALLGDLAVHDGGIYFVDFATGDGSFTVRRLPVDGSAPARDATPSLPWPGTTGAIEDSVAIDVGPDGALYVATGEERIVVGPDGAVRERAVQQTRTPRVAVSPEGAVVWSGGPASSASIPVHVDGGSGEARAVLAQFQDCAGDTLVVGTGTGGTAMPFLCEPRGIAWTSAESFVVSVGGESGAVLARVTVPEP